MKEKSVFVDIGIKHFAYTVFCMLVITFFMAFIRNDNMHEASIGDFSATDLCDAWVMNLNGVESVVDLPLSIHCKNGDRVVFTRNLPDNLTEDMNLMIRTYLEDVYVYIDGELRDYYSLEDFPRMFYSLPSAYLVLPVGSDDSQKEIKIDFEVKTKGFFDKVVLSHGNNGWFEIIKNNLFLCIIAILLAFLGAVVAIFYFALRKKLDLGRAIFYLGLTLADLGIWVLSESRLRQFIFSRPTLTYYMSYIAIELIGLTVLLYFDEVQHKNYHKYYRVTEIIMAVQITINIILDQAGVIPFRNTLILSHIWTVCGIVLVIFNLFVDIKKKRARNYLITVFGMIVFLFFGLLELLNFYISVNVVFGMYICFGLFGLLLATIFQTIFDNHKKNKMHDKEMQESWMGTIQTIASAIDAKDVYTGGHSNRVGEYACALAREMAVDYDFSEDDIMRIRYIGLMHDIGKIGVADTVLNKAGKLTDEEFTLMKKHVEIGYDLLASIDGGMEGLTDGVRHHHERFDGKGYPDGLEGTDIPLIARILCLADSYDAMTSNRVYRRRLSDKEVREEILRCAGTQFDPALAALFVNILDRGDLKPNTIDGLETNAAGRILKSALLEEKMQKDNINGEQIVNPDHIRMASYIIKLAELKDREFELVIVKETEKSSKEEITAIIKKNIRVKDIDIKYTDNQNIIVLFDRTIEEMNVFLTEISQIAEYERF